MRRPFLNAYARYEQGRAVPTIQKFAELLKASIRRWSSLCEPASGLPLFSSIPSSIFVFLGNHPISVYALLS